MLVLRRLSNRIVVGFFKCEVRILQGLNEMRWKRSFDVKFSYKQIKC